MTDREKVMNALWRCESYGYCEDKRCPYYGDTNCLESMRKDALELLKEQETVEPIDLGLFADFITWGCPICERWLDHDYKYCPYCGRKVKWDD